MNEFGEALSRLDRELDDVVRAIPEVSTDGLVPLIDRLEKLDWAYAWLLDHIPTGSVL